MADTRLVSLVVKDSDFLQCRFQGVVADRGDLGLLPSPNEGRQATRTLYDRCTFEGSDLSNLRPGWARFQDCIFQNCVAEKWFVVDADVVGCAFPGTSLRETTFSGMSERRHDADGRPLPNEISGNDFQGADLAWTSFIHGVDLRRQNWPSENDILILDNIAARIAWAQRRVEDWPEDRRERALFLLRGLTLREGPEQRDLFIHKVQLEMSRHREIDEAVLELLRGAPVGTSS